LHGLRRIIVSLGIGRASYVIMLAFMVLSVMYDRQLEPVVTFVGPYHGPGGVKCPQVLVSGACNGAHSLKQRLWLLMMGDRTDDNICWECSADDYQCRARV
jgi:hypothetical protein